MLPANPFQDMNSSRNNLEGFLESWRRGSDSCPDDEPVVAEYIELVGESPRSVKEVSDVVLMIMIYN